MWPLGLGLGTLNPRFVAWPPKNKIFHFSLLPLLILPPVVGTPGQQGYVATRPTCGPPPILSPALKRWGPPRRQGLCSHPAHLWATSDSAPGFEAVGTPSAQRRKQLVGSWAERTLEASFIDMSFAPPLIVAQRLLLIAPTRECLCLKFDPMCDRPHIVGANQEELAVVDLIAEREGVEPQLRKKWSKILDAFGALAFAIAHLHSTFIQQIDGVSCHPACLLTLHCAFSRRVVKGILQVPQDRLWLLREMAEATLYFGRSKPASTPRTPTVHWEVARMYPEPKYVDPVNTCFSCDGTPHIACHECKVLHCALHASILCQSEICVWFCQFWTANLAAVAVASVVVVAAAVDNRPSVPTVVATSAVNTRRGVWICGKWYALPPQYPQNADCQLRNDQAFCTELQGELKTALFGMCTNNPTVRGKPRHADTKADLIFKRVFRNYL